MAKTIKINRCELHTFALVFLTSSFTIVNDIISSYLTIGLWLLLAFDLLIRLSKQRTQIRENPYVVMALCTAIYILSGLINDQPVTNLLKNVFSLFTLWLYISNYKLDDFFKALYQAIYYIALISIPMYLLSVLFPSVLTSFIATGTNGRMYYNLILFNHIIGVNRNCGFFWEPGAFASFICLAILIWITQLNNEKDNGYRKIVVLLVALFLTFSTTGYLCFALILLIYLFVNKRNGFEKTIVILLFLMAILFVLPTYFPQLFGSDSEVFGKIYNFLQYKNYYLAGDYNSSVSVRLFSVIMPFKVFLANPLFGVGHDNLVEMTARFTRGSITCTFINWFAINGFAYGLLLLIGYFKLSLHNNSSIIVKVMIFIALLMIICTEDYSQNVIFTGLAFWGYKSTNINKERDALINE